jgi:hypothetical protein
VVMDLRLRLVSFLVVALLVLTVFSLFFGSFRVWGVDEASARLAAANDSIQYAFARARSKFHTSLNFALIS